MEDDLSAAVDAGDDVKLSTVEAMTVLGEVQRLKHRLDQAARILAEVACGNGCWHGDQGYAPCMFRGVEGFLADMPKRRRRWWR